MRIDYRRWPDRESVFEQRLVADLGHTIITLSERCGVPRPIVVEEQVILEPDSPVVWFTFPGAWHDIGRFHSADGRYTGLYANILTPAELLNPRHWRTTDLFLDLWISLDGKLVVLDEDELTAAETAGFDEQLARRARAEADRLQRARAAGSWPPQLVQQWTLERARSQCSEV